ncbi:hypothetical protein LTR27_008244 [Elasticomyces elasticus]|nr:hypothetical protein LTR27_008244 [Elasticomyces elasticus]
MASYQDVSHVTTGALGITQIGTGNRLYLRGQTTEAQRAVEPAACLKAICTDMDPKHDLAELSRERKRSPGTCERLLMHDKVRRRLIGQGDDVLWLTGPPGIGKTTLSVFLADQMLQSKGSSKTLLVKNIPEAGQMLKKKKFAYFFCSEQQHHDNIVVLLQGLLLQLLRQDKALLDIARAKYEHSESTCFGSVEGLWQVLREALRNSTGPQVYFLIDALDMCVPSSRTAFFALLRRIADGRASRSVRWLITCRAEEDITRAIGNGCHGAQLELQTGWINDDLQRYLKLKSDELGRDKGYSADLKQRIEKKLQSNSEGTFLWVALVLQDLKTCTKAEAGELLKKALPTELPGIYARILDRIQPRRMEQAIFVLQAVAIASRPLTVTELAVASLTRDATWHDVRHDRTSFENPSDHIDAYQVCLPILHHNPANGHLNVVHQSVKDYLRVHSTDLDPRGQRGGFGFSAEDAHYTMFTVCWRLVLIMDSAVRPGRNLESTLTITEWFTRLSNYMRTHNHFVYFWRSMFQHSYASMNRILMAFPEEDLRETPFLCDYWLWVAVSRDDKTLVEQLLRFNVDACALLGSPTVSSAMSIAIVRDDLPLVEKFVSHSRTRSSVYIYQAVVVATEQDDHYMVKLLLPQQPIMPAPGVADLTAALHAASRHDRGEIFEMLMEQAGSDANGRDAEGYTILMRAVTHERPRIIEFLLKSPETNVNLVDVQGCSALSLAAKNCNARIVELLLTHAGLDVNSGDRRGDTPLAHAVLRNAMQVLRALLHDSRLNMDTKNSAGRTPLMKATASGHHRIVKALLETGRLQISGEDGSGLTASAWAEAWCKEFPLMQNMILAAGVTPQATTQDTVRRCRQQIQALGKMSQLHALFRVDDRFQCYNCDGCEGQIGPLMFENQSSQYCQQ